MNICKITGLSLLLTFVSINHSHAGSVGGFGGATEITQLMNNIELIDVVYQEARNIQEQIKQYETMLKNLKKLDDYQVHDINTLLTDLNIVVRRGQAIAYSTENLAEKYQETFLNYDDFEGMEQERQATSNYQAIYQKQIQANHDAIVGAMEAVKAQSQQFSAESETLKQLQQQAASAQGNLEVLQASSAMAAYQSTQMQKLRQLLATQIQLQANTAASNVTNQAEEKADLIQATKGNGRHVEPDNGGVSITNLIAD